MEPVTAALAGGPAAVVTALALALPLAALLAMAVPGWRGRAAAASPLAGLGALAAGLLVADGAGIALPWLLTGTTLTVDALGRPFLLLAGILWPAAGVFARSSLAPAAFRWFTGFSLAALTGYAGVCLAPDAATFYVFYGLMGLAIYGLVFHDGGERARRAANVYLVFTVAGEGALLAALLAAVNEGALAGSWGLPLAVAALGIKFGLVPLHMWMPLAYGAVPVAAGAVLGGAMVNAGLLGWLRFLPLGGAPLPGWGGLLVLLGALAAFGGVAAGLAQRRAGAVLGYSSISQMGWVTVAVGAALGAPGHWPGGLQAVVIAYACHHGLVKGGLFLAAGLAPREAPGGRRALAAWALLAVLAAVLAGAPGTGGAAVKLALKEALAHLPGADPAAAASLLAAGAFATTLLVARLLFLARPSGEGPPLTLPAWAAALTVAMVALLLPWAWPGLAPFAAATLGPKVASTGGPVLAGALVAGAVGWFARGRQLGGRLALPPGDLLWPVVAAGRSLRRTMASRLPALARWWTSANRLGPGLRERLWLPLRGRLTAADRWGWLASGAAMLLLLGAVALTLLG
jgi:formate hydrogenlyase subunit 3/multisubunit Na+/H+ antiporter MnhD subunit